MDDQIAIKVVHLNKFFKLPHEKFSSLKSVFLNFYRRKKSYEVHHVLKDINFEVKHGEFFGIVGRNGSGKSTMLKLLAGIYSPTGGTVEVNGKLTPFIELGVGFNMELTGRENVFLNGALLGFTRREMRSMYKDIVEFAELEQFMDQKLKNYSSGMQVRLAFSIAIRAESDVLLIDEVLAVGDADFQRKCYDYFKTLKKNKKTVVLVSHDMGAIAEFCDSAILIEKGELVAEGPAREVANKYSELFMSGEEDETLESGPSRRAGNGNMRITDVTAKVVKDDIVVKVKAKVKKDVEELLYGLHILAQDGHEVTAMNNRMINVPDLKDLKAGSEVEFVWKMQNILSDGKYYVMLTLADGRMNTLDILYEAASFRVKRSQRSNTAVLPPVTVKIINK